VTEAEWFAQDWVSLWLYLRKRGVARTAAGRRRLRLFACGCCRMEISWLEGRGRRALDVAEQLADREVTEEQRRDAEQAVVQEADKLWGFAERMRGATRRRLGKKYYALCAVRDALAIVELHKAVGSSVSMLANLLGKFGDISHEEGQQWQSAVADTLRDVFGNPFRPVSFDTSWTTPTVTALANAIYTDRAFHRLPLLAGGLEEAGCDNPYVIAHCRSPGPHVRGCWVVDLLLGKA
jgi:hypothetical protein